MIGKTNAIGVVSAPVPIIKTVSGSIISISDALAQAAESLVVGIEPIQSGSGDSSPSNVRPISGWSNVKVTRTGKNLCEPTEASYKNESGSWFNGTDIASVKNALNTLPVGEYTISFKLDVLTTVSGATSWGMLIHNTASGYIDGRQNGQHNADETLSFSKTFSVTESNKGKFDHVYMYSGGGSHADVYWYDFQLEPGSPATAYEPYNGNTYTIQLGQTVYGGSLDVTTGVLTVTHQTVDLGSLSWTRRSNPNGNLSSTYLFSASPSNYGQAKSNFVGVLSSYKWVTNYNYFTEDCTAGYIYGTQIAIRDDSYTDAIAFTSAVAGQKCCYELATPQTVQLTPTEVQMLLGNNVLWTDSGDSELQYWARR